jgi:PAS domain S-box-containing protein/putative nucleotidyltransferase with HDIG domain
MKHEQNLTLGRILVVDDETELMTVVCEVLAAKGYETAGFVSGPKALEALSQRDFDVLLTDLMMPEMDGISLLRAGLEIDSNLVGVIMTGQATVKTAVEAMQMGAFDYIVKPFKTGVLLPVLSRAMEMRRLRHENIQLRETVAIHDLAKAIAFPLDVTSMLNKVADAVLQQSGANEVSIMLPTGDDGQELYVAVAKGGHPEHLLGTRVSMGEGIAGWVARNREPLVLHGPVNDKRFRPVSPRSEIKSSVSMPMMASGNLVGVLNVNVTNSLRPFSLGQIKGLSILVSIVAPVLESSWLYAQVREAEEKYRSIFEHAIEGIFQSTPDGKYLSGNPALVRMYGYESEDDLIHTVGDIAQQQYVNPEDRMRFRKPLETQGFVKGFETEFYKKNGEKVWISMNARAVNDGDGNILFYEGTVIDIMERKSAETALKKSHEKLHDTLNATVIALATAVEMRDPYTAGHQRRVAHLASAIAKEMGLPDVQMEGVWVMGLLHDVGKIGIPAEILSKPGKLNEYEFSLIQTHPGAGYDVVKAVSFPWPVAQAILQHHERLNGSGYPSQSCGEAIIPEARILAVADVVEAMTSHRPYRPAHTMTKALEEISEKKGILYDPVVVEACVRIIREKGLVLGEGDTFPGSSAASFGAVGEG